MHLRLVLFITALTLAACNGKGTQTQQPAQTGSAQVSLHAALRAPAPAGAPGYTTQSKSLTFAKDVTLTSIRVALANINLHGREGERGDDLGGLRERERNMQPSRDSARTADDNPSADDVTDDTSPEMDDDTLRFDIDFAGPFVFDLTDQTITPSLEAVTIPAGRYKKIDLTFHAMSSTDATQMGLAATDPIVGNSYVIEGLLNHVTVPNVVTDGTVKLVIFGSQERTYRVNLKRGIEVTSGNANDLLLVFDSTGWFPDSLIGQLRSGLNEGNVAIDTSGPEPVVYLDANRNSSIAASFNQLFHSGVKLTKDKDSDDEVDDDEETEQVGGDESAQ